jgi:uncharacterized protein
MPVKTPRRLVLCSLAAILWMVAAVPAHAALVAGLYEARVPVADQSSSARSAALQQAFAAVLMKVTGARSVPAPLSATLGDAAHYVQQYRYEQVPPDPSAPTTSSQTPSLVLWARFDSKVVNDAIAAAHAPLWGAERPRTLVWLALQDTPGGRLLAASDNSFLMQALQTATQQRGIVLVFPQMDAVDHAALGVPDVTAFSADRIRQASSRYRPDAVLVGSITPFGTGQYAAHWQLMSGSEQQNWETPPGDEVVTSVDGVQVSADRYAARYAIAAEAGELNGVQLSVQGVTTLDTYAKVLAYLSGLTPVRAVHLQRMAEGSAYFTLDAHGTLDGLQSALVLGGLLTPANRSAAPSAASATSGTSSVAQSLSYSYVPTP